MKTHSFAAASLGVSLNGTVAWPVRAGMAAQIPARSLRKRISAMLRLACRVLGLKRRKGLGLAVLGASGVLLLADSPAQAANGIHINANADGPCVSIDDPRSRYMLGGTLDVYLRENVNFTDSTSRCVPGESNQKDYVLFYRPSGVNGIGATSLSLGGQLSVNSGFLKLGDVATGQRIGNWETSADALGLAIGNGAQARRWGVGLGIVARATGSEGAISVGNNSQASADYTTVFGVASSASASRATILGPSGIANAVGGTGVGRFAQPAAVNSLALGRNSKVEGADSVGIGMAATAPDKMSVALGAGSGTRAFEAPQAIVLNGVSYAFDSSRLQGVVSGGTVIRSRQFINVAPGMVDAKSLDAVNGSQLFAAYDGINTLGASDRAQQAAIDKNAADLAATRARQGATTASFARLVGGGASVDAQGKVVMPATAPGGPGAGSGQPSTVLAGIVATDRGLKVQDGLLGDTFDSALTVEGKADQVAATLEGFGPNETVAGRIDEVRKNSLMWDPSLAAYTASQGGDGQKRVSNVAPGQAATDAVNKGQLDEAVAQVKGNGLVRESGGQLRVGQDSGAAAVNVAGNTPQRDANGNPVIGGDGRPVMAQADRQVTGVAAGVNGNDAVNKGQLDGVARAAGAAQAAAANAGTSAATAQGAAVAAQNTANAAQGVATGAGQAAEAAQRAAAAAQQSADGASARLGGIGAGETVLGRTDQAIKAATDAAGQAAGQALAGALGGGSVVGADGKATAPAYAVSQIGADGKPAAQAQTVNNVGAALAAIDANGVKVNARVLAQEAKATELTQDLGSLRHDSLQWDQDADAFSASHGGQSPNRVVNLADGQARTDAINKGQLDTVAQTAAGAARTAADAQQAADAAQSAATGAQQAARSAQGTAAEALQTAEAARDTAAGAQRVAEAAQGTATQAQQASGVAQGAAAAAQQAAGAAQDAAAGAQRTAQAAQGATTQAQQTALGAQAAAADARTAAEAAQQAATSARQSGEAASAKLAGIGDGETVVGRIDQAAKAATDAAGRAASQALADALGGGSTVGADGKVTAPAYGVSQIGADGKAAAQGQTANNVGAALTAVDANVIKVNDRVRAQAATAGQLLQDTSDLRDDGLLWDRNAQAFSATHGGDSPNRIVGVAAGAAATDAVNQGQLNTVAQTANVAATDAADAQRIADAARGTAVDARQTAESAQGAAASAQQSADAANAKLAGIGDNETVAGRIAQAAQAANQSLADALGGGAAVRADGTVQGPAYAVTAIGPEGRAQPPSAPAANVADAIKTIDGSVVAVNDNVNKIGADVTSMRDQLNAGELGLVRQDAAARDITVAAQSDGTRVRMDGTAGARALAGVKAGEVSAASTEAVVGSQLFSVSQDLQRNSQAVGDLEALTGRQGVTLAALSDQVRSGDVGLTRHDPSTGTVSLAADRGGNTVAVSGADGERLITGLQEGRIQAGSADAVTGGQLNAVAERVGRLNAQGAGVAADSRGDGSDRAMAAPGSRGVAVGANAQATGENSVATGAGARAQGAGATATGAGATAQAAGSTAIGANATASAPGSVALGEGSQATRANTVSVGSAGAERQIVNVAPAIYGTDVVNLRQAINLSRQDANQARQQANRHTDSRVGQLRRESNAGIASAMAMAALPSTSTPGKSMFAVGASSYGGQSAVAMGVSARSQSGTWIYRASMSGTTGGQTGASIGLTYAW